LGTTGRWWCIFPCSIARDKAKRPVGELHVANAAENPNYTFKPELFAEDAESTTLSGNLLIPPGPNNPVGVAWLSLDRPGYGIHGTPNPEDIGRTESHGCFRLANWNARKLVGMVTIGIPVTVFDQ
jgi:lipoprotein-anchoring transpeptidase ErfK/SrfK